MIKQDWLYGRDQYGNIETGRVDIGDKIEVLDVSYSKQLAYIIYPTPQGVRRTYVANGAWISYFNADNGTMVENASVYDKSNGSVIGSLSKGEKVTTLQTSGEWINVVYSTDKGHNTKSGSRIVAMSFCEPRSW